MKLKLLVPFTVSGFAIRSEMPVHDPEGYARFWEQTEEAYNTDREKPPWRSLIANLRFAHAPRYAGRVGNRYRSLDTDSLVRSLHVLEIELEASDIDMSALFWRAVDAARETVSRNSGGDRADGPDEDGDGDGEHGLIRSIAESVRQNPPEVLIRAYNHTIGLVELDLHFDKDWLVLGKADPREELDFLQQVGVEFAEQVIQTCEQNILRPLLRWLRTRPARAGRYLHGGLRSENSSVSTAPSQDHANASPVLWVTRTLVFERTDLPPGTRPEQCDRRETIIEHWLKDVAGSKKREEIAKAVAEPNAQSSQWLNYLFREESYAGQYPPSGWWRAPNRLAEPFCQPWEAMINSQYYYAAFDVMQTR